MPKHSLSRLIDDLGLSLKAVVLVSLIFTSFSFLNLEGFLFELTTHFPVPYLVVGLIGCVFFFTRQAFVFLMLSTVLFLANLFILSDYPLFASTNVSGSNAQKVFVANVLTSNTKYQEFIDLIKSERPAIVVVLEVNQNWVNALRSLDQLYPYKLEVPQEDNFGMLLLSNLPFISSRSEPLGESHPIFVDAVVKIANKAVTVIGVHTVPPVSSHLYELRNQQLQILATIVQKNNLPTIVLGDLNTTIWALSFRQFMKVSGLNNPRKDFGIIPTWFTNRPFLGVPIDHILTSEGVRVVNLKSVTVPGSDHLGLIAEVVVE